MEEFKSIGIKREETRAMIKGNQKKGLHSTSCNLSTTQQRNSSKTHFVFHYNSYLPKTNGAYSAVENSDSVEAMVNPVSRVTMV